MQPLIVIGAGGHAKVVVDIAMNSGQWRVIGLLDDEPSLTGRRVLGAEVLGTTAKLLEICSGAAAVVIGVGSNSVRERFHGICRGNGIALATLVHPAATVAASVRLGAGTVVMAKAVVNPDSLIGEGAIVNTAASIDHDCVIGDFAHIAPGALLCGGVRVGARALVGVGACVTPGVAIGADSIVAAGAAVTRDVLAGGCVGGVPAREMSRDV